MNTGYIAAIATLICWTAGAFIIGKLSRLMHPHALNKALLFFGIFLLGIVVCVIDEINPMKLFSLPNSSNWLWLGLSGILGKSLGDYCGLSALRILGPRRRYMLATLTPGFSLFAGFIFLDETISALGIAGMFITMISLALLLNDQKEKDEVIKDKFGNYFRGVVMALCSGILTAFAFVFAKKTMIETGNPISEFHATWIRILIAFIVLFVIDVFTKKDHDFILEVFKDKQKIWLMGGAVFIAVILGLSLSLVAITRLEVAIAYTIFSLVPLGVLLVSVLWYHKKIVWRSWIYCLMAIAGVMILIWRNTISSW